MVNLGKAISLMAQRWQVTTSVRVKVAMSTEKISLVRVPSSSRRRPPRRCGDSSSSMDVMQPGTFTLLS